MIYDLPLAQRAGTFTKIDIEKNKEIKAKIEKITDFEKKLSYYNTNIRSLVKFPKDGKIYFEWGNPDQRLEIYCGCKTCRSLPKFNPEHEQIFFKLKENEVKRLVNGIKQSKSYQAKLTFLFSTKGFTPDQTPQVFTTDPFLDRYEQNEEAETESIINLLPRTKDERTVYNDFVRQEFDSQYMEGGKFSQAYSNFDSEKEKQRLEKTLENAIEPQRLIEYLIGKIERYFGYPENINAEYSENYIKKKIRQQLELNGLPTDCFTKMVLGISLDLDKYLLDSHILMHYVHISEVVKFYRYLKELLKKDINIISRIKGKEASETNDHILKSGSEVNINEILLLGLSEPDYSRVEFWQKNQTESGYSDFIFLQKLKDSWNYYNTKLEAEIFGQQNLGFEKSDLRLPLVYETNFRLKGHFGKSELHILNKSLKEYEGKLTKSYEPQQKSSDSKLTKKDMSRY